MLLATPLDAIELKRQGGGGGGGGGELCNLCGGVLGPPLTIGHMLS